MNNNIINNVTGMYVIKDGDLDVVIYTYNVVNLDTGKIEQMGVQKEIQMMSADILARSRQAISAEAQAIATLREMIGNDLGQVN